MSADPFVPQSLHVFLVEDHIDTLRYLKMFLEGTGYQVSTARTMAEALADFPGSHADLLLSDIGLSDGSGWELLRLLRRAGPVYAFAMSGFGTLEEQTQSRDAGYRRHFTKPFNPEELEQALADAAVELKAVGN